LTFSGTLSVARFVLGRARDSRHRKNVSGDVLRRTILHANVRTEGRANVLHMKMKLGIEYVGGIALPAHAKAVMILHRSRPAVHSLTVDGRKVMGFAWRAVSRRRLHAMDMEIHVAAILMTNALRLERKR